jgi:LPS-assembly protein
LPVRLRPLLLPFLLLVASAAGWNALAQTPPPASSVAAPASGGTKPPVLLLADEMIYDENANTVTAKGNVRLVRDGVTLRADSILYDRANDKVNASGNLSLTDESNNVVFGDRMELTSDLRDGFIENVRGLFSDNARFAGQRARREDGDRTTIDQGVYSPCELCEDGTRAPTWQIKAVRVIHDQSKKDVIYRDAWLELAGIPVFYTPYFRHPDPSVDRRTGLLFPSTGFTTDLGVILRNNYYVDIAPDKDLTLEGSITQKQGPVLGAEYRQRFAQGLVKFSGSITHADRRESRLVREKNKWRGHIFGNGRFDISDSLRTGFEIARTTDRGYLRTYDYSKRDLLRNRAYMEWFQGRSYGQINVMHAQDLRLGISQNQPFVIPYSDVTLYGDQAGTFGGTWRLNAGMLGLSRPGGQDIGRISAEASWQRTFVTEPGLVTSLTASARGQAYWIRQRNLADRVSLLNNRRPERSNWETEALPQIHAVTRMPFARPFRSGSLYIEPTVALTAAPRIKNPGKVPNEDSRDIELDTTNIFNRNRFPGIDRLEDGARLTYGARAGYQFDGGGNASLFLGQSYRFDDHLLYPRGSGLEEKFSDLVGRLQVAPGRLVDLDYRFRLSRDGLSSQLHEVSVYGGTQRIQLALNYLFVNRVEGTGINDSRNELTIGVTTRVTDHWSIGVQNRTNLGEGFAVLQGRLELIYEDDCFLFSIAGERDRTERTSGLANNKVIFRFIFKSLGGFTAG